MTTATAAASSGTASSARPRLLVTGVVLACLLAIGGVVSTLPYLALAPLVVTVETFAVSAATLVGAVPAIRRRLWGWWLVVGSTALAGLASAPVYLAPEVPQEVVLPTTVANGVTLLALVLLVIGRPRRGAPRRR